jgi:Amt family ammonium transporter
MTDPLTPQLQASDQLWVLISSALVLFMTPGLALFYGGMVKAKNVLSTLTHSFFCIGLISVIWVSIGYSLCFAPGHAVIGNLDYLFLQGVGSQVGPYSSQVSHLSFMIFQLMFAIITPAIISGAFAERIKFKSYVLFTMLWTILVYAPICHWVWGEGGWLRQLGALDFAGGTVVHISSGVAGLAVALKLGARQESHQHRPHNLGLTILGAGMLWFGWFGFNAGSALAANHTATHAFVTTHFSASAGAMGWAIIEMIRSRKVSALGIASGAIAGLVAITPACAFVGIVQALIVGLVSGVLCNLAVDLKNILRYDDALDAFGIHGVGGAWGAIATGIFTTKSLSGQSGLIESGHFELVYVQFVSVLITALYAFSATYLITWGLQKTVGLRVEAEQEAKGLDASLHGEQGYALHL